VAVRSLRKEIMATVTNYVGFLHGVVGKRQLFVAAAGAEQKATTSAITAIQSRK
jgi:hypothetical protein